LGVLVGVFVGRHGASLAAAFPASGARSRALWTTGCLDGRMGALTWSGCTNVRDLGGLPVEGGGAVRDRALVRSDSLTRLDDDGVRALDAYGVARVIDLRAEAEALTSAHPYAGADVPQRA